MKEENETMKGICGPIFDSGDREDNDSFEAILKRCSMDIIVLPGDFVMAILIALPIKSLLRFKSVCWSWHDLILSRRFINIHHDQAKRNCLICFYKWDGTRSYNSISVSEDGIVTDLCPPPTLSTRRHYIYVTNACRGIVCFSSGACPNSVGIWNIATREFRILHGITERAHCINHVSTRFSNREMRDLSTGFTFLAHANEYKLVRVIIYCNNTVYIKITRWNSMIFLPTKEMDMDFPYEITQYGRCVNTNEAIHWLGHKIGGGPTIVIAFDMIEEKFREISTPFSPDQKEREFSTRHQRKLVLVNENRLAIFGALFTGKPYLSYTVWTLNDYGGALESWAKQYKFKTRYDLQPLGFWFNGDLVVARMDDASEKKMSLYDYHTDQIKDFPVEVNRELYFSSVLYYKESLVPLPPTISHVCPNEYCPF